MTNKPFQFFLAFSVLFILSIFISCNSDDGPSNSLPMISDAQLSIEENSENGTVVGTVDASDQDEGQDLGYAITEGNIDEAFSVNSSGQLSVNNSEALDYERNPNFTLILTVEDSEGGIADAMISIEIINQIVLDQSFSIEENSATGSIIGTIQVDDSENPQFTILSGNENNSVEINNSGELLILDSAQFDYELTENINLEVVVEDGSGESQQATISVEIVNLEPATTGLAAYFPLNGNANDESGNGNNGTISGPVITDGSDGNTNAALQFDGVNDFIDITGSLNNLSDNSSGAISFWFKPFDASPETTYYVVSLGDTDQLRFMTVLLFTGEDGVGKIRFGIRDLTPYLFLVEVDYTEEDNTWTNIVCVQDGSSPRIYVNGEALEQTTILEQTDSDAWFDDVPEIDNGRLGFLDQNNRQQGYFNGSLDEVRFYNRALTSDEIIVLSQEFE